MARRSRLLASAAAALVDRMAIDWDALRSRASSPRDRLLVANLRAIAALRDRGRPARRTSPSSRLAATAARLLVGIASVQLAASFVVIGAAMATAGTIGSRAPQLLLAIAFAVGSVPLAAISRREERALFLLAMFALASAAFACSAVAGLSTGARSGDPMVRGVAPESFVPACLWQFAADFPRVRRFTAFDTAARRATAIAWLLGSLLFGVNLLVAHHAIEASWLQALVLDHPSRWFWQLFAAMLLPAVAVIFVRARRAPAAERRRVVRFACALSGGLVPFLASGLAWALLPRIADWLPQPSASSAVWVDRIVLASLTAMPILASAAVTVDGSVDLSRGLRRSLPSVVARNVLTAIRLTLIATLLLALYAGLAIDRSGPSWMLPLAVGISVVAIAIAFHPGWLGLVFRVTSGFARRDRQLARALDAVRRARGGREAAAVVAREIRRTVGAQTVRVFAAESDLFVGRAADEARLPASAILVRLLSEAERPLDLSADGLLRAALPQSDRAWVEANQVELATPLARRDGEIVAIVVLGAKRGGYPYDRHDVWLVASLAAAASAALGESSRVDAPDDLALECARCGLVSETAAPVCRCDDDRVLAALPHRLGDKFIVRRRIGAGGMGIVYEAHDATLGRDVALKTLPALHRDAVRRLRLEARAMAALSHESLATIYGLEIWRETPVLVVEYFPSGTLARRIANGPLPLDEVLPLGIRVAGALDFMHGSGRLHRDLKPSNIALTATGLPKLLDFGLASLTDSDAQDREVPGDENDLAVERLAGTPAYLPPEAVAGAPPTPAVDLWGLAVTLFEALTGVNPFAAGGRMRRDDAPALALVPPAIRAFFVRALAPDPADRFQTARDLRATLESLTRHDPSN